MHKGFKTTLPTNYKKNRDRKRETWREIEREG